MMERENRLLVPAVAKMVPEAKQKSFNNRVLLGLGVLDSRLHLVHMHEAVFGGDAIDDALDMDTERRLFRSAIPSIPQKMIARWRKKLYDPVAGVLEER